ncbi:MAG: PEP-CTERM sorting domain-containing protein [Pseudomonadota bacterium]
MAPKANRKFKHKKLSLAVGVALAASASITNALMITDSIEAGALAEIPGDSQTMDDGPSATFASAQAGVFDFLGGNTADGFAFGRDTGRYAATANINGDGMALGDFFWERTVTNDQADPLNIFLDVFLYGGFLQVDAEGQEARYSWSIISENNGAITTVLDSEVTIDGMNIVENGADGGLDQQDNDDAFFYNWSARNINDIALGTLLPNESLTITYMLETTADGSGISNSAFCDFGNEEGGRLVFDGVDEGYGGCFASVFTGDPNSLNTDPLDPNDQSVRIVGVPVPTTGIPEPGSLALMGAGLAGAAGARRKKKEKKSDS